MYRITNISTGETIGTVDKPYYIKISASGCFTPATEDKAVGVAVNSTAYNLLGHNEIEGADTVTVSEFDGGALVESQQKAIDTLIISALEV